MKYSLSESSQEILLNDRWSFHRFGYIFMMLMNIIMSVSSILRMSIEKDYFIFWFWIILGLISTGLLFSFIFKISGKEKLYREEIAHMEVKDWTGKKRLSLKLKNGKNRHLVTKHNASEFLNFFKELGIPVK